MAAVTMQRLAITTAFTLMTAKIFLEFRKIQDVPYMDEIFHIPQAQNYCHGNYLYWDNKITTLPGLYIFSQLFLNVLSLSQAKAVKDLCSVAELRCTNIIFIVLCCVVISMILKETEKEGEEKQKKKGTTATNAGESSNGKIFTAAAIISTFPVLYFFAFLYYTDVGSTLFVLLSYFFGMRKQHWGAAMTGVIAIIFRQTNIVWVGFTCAGAIIQELKEKKHFTSRDLFYVQVYKAIMGCLKDLLSVLSIAFPYLLVLLGFVAFVIKNDGIVVGDRSSHEASLNFPQILYFAAFTMFFASFLLLRYVNLRKTLTLIWQNLTYPIAVLSGILIVAMSIAVKYFTYVHLYLVSDNRHYTFYIWKNVFGVHPLAKYILIPGYFVALLIILNELSKRRDTLWIALFLACASVALVPQKLLEFRYFIVPYLLFRMNINPSSWLELFVEGTVYLLVNALTMNIFLTRTHTQNGRESQRIMW